MLELDRDMVARTLLLDGVPENQLDAAVNAVFEANESEEEDPILDLLGPDGVDEVVGLNAELAERGMGIEQRAEVVEERIADIIGAALSTHAEELEEALAANPLLEDVPRRGPSLEPSQVRPASVRPGAPVAIPGGPLPVPSQQPDPELRRLEMLGTAGLLSPAAVKFFRVFLSVDVDRYASIRRGCATGDNGRKGLRKKRRRLCVVATTAGAHVAVKLLWWTVFSQSAVGTLVVGTHFRGWVPVLLNGAEPLVVGASRNGRTISKSRNAAVVAKICLFVDKDPNLRNVNWFGRSNDSESGIRLAVSGSA